MNLVELAQFLPRNTLRLLLPAALRTTYEIGCEFSIIAEFSHALGTYYEGAEVHDPREAFHLCPCGTDCGIYSQFVNHDLRSEKNQKGLEVRRHMTQTRSVPGCITSIHAGGILSGSSPRRGRIIRT